MLIVLPVLSFAQIKYEKSFEIDSQIGLKETEGVHYRFGIEMVNGVRFSQLFSCGVGIGFQTGKYEYKKTKNYHSLDYTISAKNSSFIPIYFRAKLNLAKKQVSPFLAFNIGYLTDIGDTSLVNASSFLAEGNVGIDITLKEMNKLYIMLGYTSHQTQMYISDFNHIPHFETIAERMTKMISLRLGFSF